MRVETTMMSQCCETNVKGGGWLRGLSESRVMPAGNPTSASTSREKGCRPRGWQKSRFTV